MVVLLHHLLRKNMPLISLVVNNISIMQIIIYSLASSLITPIHVNIIIVILIILIYFVNIYRLHIIVILVIKVIIIFICTSRCSKVVISAFCVFTVHFDYKNKNKKIIC